MASTSSATSTAGSRRSCACGTRSTRSTSHRLRTSGSTTGSTSDGSRGAADRDTTSALENVFTADHAWARLVVEEVRRKIADPATMRALGYCVSVGHAHFMAERFSELGLPAVALSAASRPDERRGALRDLSDGTVRAVFTVDLFNEGVDIPNVDTLLLLRPTESPTLFLQQLGRGLRKAAGKSAC